ncbi:thiamine biosynthesis protein MoeB [Bacillus sp. FJAT-42376]|uniref:ThiF family adenylyltransferase n=1 Tax=Bacillus sp. FJAT-42376 TaxID=2014076 RepID=UPI000F507F09|nr:ThiF family adenylyltransferase [Bacillus sp. FJAT-42376]AZB44173.1 thiamine biosynthesis protein MoeB [Bacillus sp. FJAT-42376]
MNERYSRQVLFFPNGQRGQEEISAKTVLLIGCGALGSGIAETLVRAGIGKLIIVDRDYVDESNLQRQQLFSEQDAVEQMPKAEAARRRLKQISSHTHLEAHVLHADPRMMEQIISSGIDLIMDGTDNFETRWMINDLAYRHGIPWIYGACIGSYGLSCTFIPGNGPCLACLMGKMPMGGETCDTAGIIAPAVSMTVSHQTAQALKILSGSKEAVRTELYSFDVWNNRYASMKIDKMKKNDCSTCGSNPDYPFLQMENTSRTAVLCGRDTVQIRPPKDSQISLEESAERLAGKVENLSLTPFLLSFKKGAYRVVAFKDGRVLVHGTKNTNEARSLYSRYFG